MTAKAIQENVAGEYPDYLRDESRRVGRAESISFPRCEVEACETLAWCAQRRRSVTVQGARTGIAAGAVPEGGHILNLSRMNRVRGLRREQASGHYLVRVEPGVLLQDLRASLARGAFDTAEWSGDSLRALDAYRAGPSFFFPPDPTETTASVGGMVSCNASGACTFAYGPTRRYVEALRVALADGDLLDLARGRERCEGRQFRVATARGAVCSGELPGYAMPAVKNAAGYHVQDNMDLLDLFVGAEGTLGAVVEAELRLLPLPPVRWGVLVFLPSLPASLDLVRRVRRSGGAAALEFFDGRALELLRRQKATNPAFAELEEIPAGAAAAVYVEYHGTDEDAVTLAVGALAEDAAACGASDESTRAATSDREMERLKAFRHALPEAVNLLIGERKKTEPGLTKLGTDMAVPDAHLEAVVRLYEDGLGGAGLDSVMFGHIGNNHLHVNILPRSLADYEAGKALYLEWARAVVAMGGSVSAEHGIGKLKVALLETLYGVEAVRQMRAVKRVFDPQGRMCPGNLFAPEAVL